MDKYTLDISITLLGPFLTASTGMGAYGVDQSFFRDYKGNLVVPGSHIKGKARMAMRELASLEVGLFDIDFLFGRLCEDGSYEPQRGALHFSDFVCSDGESMLRTRVSIDAKTATASQNQLWTHESPYESGTPISCAGKVSFWAESGEQAGDVAGALKLGLVWLTNLGAEKGVGYGRIKAVEMGEPVKRAANVAHVVSFTDACQLRIKPIDPIIVGGIQKPRTNFIASEKHIAGGVIKGALATSLNRAFGVRPVHQPLGPETADRYPGFENLVAQFEKVRVSHAFPAQEGAGRPVKLPLSAVNVLPGANGVPVGGDVALSTDNGLVTGGMAPFYAVDWKIPVLYAGAANPREIYRTRTAIDHTTRRSQEGQLYTYTYLCPEEEPESGQEPTQVAWIGNVDFSGVDAGVHQAVSREFGMAVTQYLDQLGKRNSRVEIQVQAHFAEPALQSFDVGHEGWAIVTLQSDCMMLDPKKVAALDVGADLSALYDEYWQALHGGTLKFVDFFASQSFRGGYLFHRYLGAGKDIPYEPYYLTDAGSVFMFEVQDENGAKGLLETWKNGGLPLPQWAMEKYGADGRLIWQNCPFVPENGYGEIAVNLEWHWVNRI